VSVGCNVFCVVVFLYSTPKYDVEVRNGTFLLSTHSENYCSVLYLSTVLQNVFCVSFRVSPDRVYPISNISGLKGLSGGVCVYFVLRSTVL
jgi:hypothetical protein